MKQWKYTKIVAIMIGLCYGICLITTIIWTGYCFISNTYLYDMKEPFNIICRYSIGFSFFSLLLYIPSLIIDYKKYKRNNK